MCAERTGVIAGTSGELSRVLYRDATGWKRIPGIDSFSLAIGEAPSNTFSAFEGSFATTGRATVGDATFNVASYAASHPAWVYLSEQFRAGNVIQWRVETRQNDIFTPDSGATAAIAANTGIVTFAGSGSGSAATDLPNVAAGHAFRFNNTLRPILSVSDAATPEFIAPGGAQAAAAYKVVKPGLLFAFPASIRSMGSVELGLDSALSSSLVLTPTSPVPHPTMVVTPT